MLLKVIAKFLDFSYILSLPEKKRGKKREKRMNEPAVIKFGFASFPRKDNQIH